MKSLRLAIATSVLFAFAAGLAAGVLVNRRTEVPPEETYLDRLTEQYDLADEQARAIRGHLNAEKSRIDAILEGLESTVKESIRAARDEAERKIRDELTEEQRIAFDRDRAGE